MHNSLPGFSIAGFTQGKATAAQLERATATHTLGGGFHRTSSSFATWWSPPTLLYKCKRFAPSGIRCFVDALFKRHPNMYGKSTLYTTRSCNLSYMRVSLHQRVEVSS